MRKILFLSLSFLLLAGCTFTVSPAETPTPTPVPFYTATLLPTFTPHPSATYAPPTITPTIQPLDATTNAQVNVRSGPDQSQASLGLLDFGTKVEIVGKDAGGKWWRIVYPGAPAGFGWVTAAFISFSGDVDKIPVVDVTEPDPAAPNPGETAVATQSPTPTPRTASVTKKINVRSGPATANTSLGMIEANTTVTLTGRNEINTWVQIEFTGGPDGKGWVAALYLQDADLKGLPYYDNDGKLLYAPTPDPSTGSGQPTPTPTGYIAAAADNDSETQPGVHQTLSPDGEGTLIYSSELSSPSGDDTDWVAFTLDGSASESSYLYFRLDCTGNGAVTATLKKDGNLVADGKPLQCGNYGLAMKVLNQKEYMLVLRIEPSGSILRFISYKLTIKASP